MNCHSRDIITAAISAGLANGGELQPASSEAELKEKLRLMVEAQKAIDPDYAKLKGAPYMTVPSRRQQACHPRDWNMT